ncbi:amino acid ABC transporter permease [uncultured Enterovirga sp.]|uniref:amino acid ABC transporter permease n=1 Tax=uncultured Enterovirga sp. TaxID=2026352 RepID=UPI0035C9F590
MKLDWSILLGPSGDRLLEGAAVTLQLAATSLALALILGFFFGVLRWLQIPWLKPVCWFYVEFFRNTPPLVQILFWYFSSTVVLPEAAIVALRDYGFQFIAATFALGLYHSGFVAEIVRGGLNAIPRGQYEAAQAIGFTLPQTVRAILAPQLLRIVSPMLTSEAVSLVKNTSLALAIGVTEITYQARYIDVYTFRGVEALLVVTLFYLIVCFAIAGFGNLMQRFLQRNRRVVA